MLYTPKDKAEAFNKYFAGQRTTESINHELPDINALQRSIDQLTLTSDQVTEILKNLDSVKAVNSDLMHNKILTATSEAISKPLTQMFN